MSKTNSTTQIEFGYCQCGCGRKVPAAVKTSKRDGLIKGQPTKYLAGHHNRIPVSKYSEYFWSCVNTTDSKSDCWEWARKSKTQFGYGIIVVDQVRYLAHRYAWIITNGDIPDGLEVCHSCDNPSCCNPYHLFLGTHKDNMMDKKSKGRSLAGENHNMVKLTRKQVHEIRERYSGGGIYQRELAIEYKLSQSHISDIVNNKKWFDAV